jgi:hypothetical protein
MENSERQIALIKNIVSAYANTYELYDLYLMDKRLIAIHTGEVNPTAWGVAGGLVGMLIAEGAQRIVDSSKKAKIKNLTLDKLLEKDKNNFAIAYESIEQIKLYDSNRELEIKSGPIQKTFAATKEQFERLGIILPTINPIKDKLTMHALKKNPYVKKCVQCGEDIPLASEECAFCGSKQP